MILFEEGDFAVKVLSVMGMLTATIQRVEEVDEGGVVSIVDSGLIYSAETGREINPVIPGCYGYLVPFDGGEVETWNLAGGK